MAERGFDAWWPHDKLAVRGYVEVLGHFRELLGDPQPAWSSACSRDTPDAFIGVDAPDFNLGLEAQAARPPASRRSTSSARRSGPGAASAIEKIGRADRPACCASSRSSRRSTPSAGINAVYVGHPLAERDPARGAARRGARRARHRRRARRWSRCCPAAAAPRSSYIAPRLFGAAARDEPGAAGRCASSSRSCPGCATRSSRCAGSTRPTRAIELLDGRAHEALAACDVALVASGTATLEAALFKRPMVVVYAMHALSWQMGKRMHYQPWVSLPNILLRDFAVPELLQGDATPAKIAAAALRLARRSRRAPSRCASASKRIHRELRRDTGALATAAIDAVLAA